MTSTEQNCHFTLFPFAGQKSFVSKQHKPSVAPLTTKQIANRTLQKQAITVTEILQEPKEQRQLEEYSQIWQPSLASPLLWWVQRQNPQIELVANPQERN